jgi:hypothetical protein
MEEFKEVLLNGMSVARLSAYMVFGIIGASMYLLYKISGWNKNDNGKPTEWSWSFFFKDNTPRMLFTFFFVYLWARFDLVGFIPEGWNVFGDFSYILIGLLTDSLVAYGVKKLKSLEVKV